MKWLPRDGFPATAYDAVVGIEGTNTSLCALYGWARRGQRVYFEAPHNWGKNITLLSSMSVEGMGPSVGRTASIRFGLALVMALAIGAPPAAAQEQTGDGSVVT